MPQVGFVVVSHSNPDQTARLMRCLNAVYGHPPIALHHDFDQCPAEFQPASNVEIVHPSIRTSWGGFSVVEAILAAIRVLFEQTQPPDWCCLLSGSCYPTKRAAEVVADLENGAYDAYIHHERIDPLNPRRRFHRECVRRYFGWRCRLPDGTYRNVALPRLTSLWSPYARHGFDCYAGAHWFNCNRRTALHLLRWRETGGWLAEHLRLRSLAEESYFQTVLCNEPALRLSGNHFRYVDWAGRGAHPRVLGIQDLPAVFASGAHFARKFAPDSPVLDRLEERLDVSVDR